MCVCVYVRVCGCLTSPIIGRRPVGDTHKYKNTRIQEPLHRQKGSNFENVDHFDRKEQSSGFSVLARSLL